MSESENHALPNIPHHAHCIPPRSRTSISLDRLSIPDNIRQLQLLEGHDMEIQYWDYLPNLDDHPDFASESPVCQERMVQFSRALAKLRRKNWTPKSTAEAQKKDCQIAEDAALSRLRPIPDGPDPWELCRSSTGTAGPPSQGSSVVGTGSVADLGLTGTCVAGGHPLQT
jgi:hypothetical protein